MRRQDSGIIVQMKNNNHGNSSSRCRRPCYYF